MKITWEESEELQIKSEAGNGCVQGHKNKRNKQRENNNKSRDKTIVIKVRGRQITALNGKVSDSVLRYFKINLTF